LTASQTIGLGWAAPDLEAAGLRSFPELYTSEAFADLEARTVFSRSWALVASAEQVGPGRYVALVVGGAPVVLWRDREGTCRAFHNLCRHRGIPLVEGEGALGRFVTCPYHQWSFDLGGALVRMPQPDQFPDADPASLGLRPVPVAEWHGMIFVYPSADPPDFAAHTAFLARRLAGHLEPPLVEVARADYTVECNWKLLVENHVDVYHLWYLHQRSLAAYRHTAFEWDWDGEAWWSREPLKDPAQAPAVTGGLLASLADEERCGIGAHLLFPNLMLVTTSEYLATYDARPAGPGRTDMTLRIRSTPGCDAGRLVASVRSFLAEDVKACESMQRATRSPFYQVGPTAVHHEQPVRIFHSLLRAKMLGR
jgi:phenylpropionate dioxygenase-like ring-hydroxylating dioxygenase large terminal subunit